MLKTSQTTIKRATLQRVGNKLNGEINYSTQEEIPFSHEEEELLKSFFLNSIRNSQDLYKFCHHISLDYNTVYDNSIKFFENQISFIEYSNHILNHLFEKSEHPQIKVGELFIVEFENIGFQDITTNAIGIFKIEKKIDYLKFQLAEQDLDFSISKGVKLQKVDKGCLIICTEKADGLRIISVDNNNYDANYWKKGFLNLDDVLNDSYQTKHHLQLLSNFSNTMAEEGDSFVQKEFISQGIQLFNENEVMTQEIIQEQLLSPFDVVDRFDHFKSEYKKENNLDLNDHFQVSVPTLKKEKRKIKSQINLDTKIQIKLDLSDGDSVKENIEKGFDPEKRMYFYKVFYNVEQ